MDNGLYINLPQKFSRWILSLSFSCALFPILLIRGDNPLISCKAELLFFFKEHVAVGPVNSHILNECVVLEINFHNKEAYIISLHRSSSQSWDEFDLFLLNFE